MRASFREFTEHTVNGEREGKGMVPRGCGGGGGSVVPGQVGRRLERISSVRYMDTEMDTVKEYMDTVMIGYCDNVRYAICHNK